MDKKEFKTYEQQLLILESRGLIISNRDKAIRCLETNNYYSIINGFKNVFLASTSPEKYLSDCDFDLIWKIYSYDKWVRNGIMPIMLEIESTLKCVISYDFAEKYGAYGYFNLGNYSQNKKSKAENLIKEIKKIIDKAKNNKDTQYDCIRHYLAKPSAIPIWVLFNFFTLGNIGKFFELLSPDLKDHITNHLCRILNRNFTSQDLYSYIHNITIARNLCAHNQRIYCYKPITSLSSKSNIMQYLVINLKKIDLNNLNTLFISLRELSKTEIFIEFMVSFVKHFTSLFKDESMSKNKILSQRIFNDLNIDLKVLTNLMTSYITLNQVENEE